VTTTADAAPRVDAGARANPKPERTTATNWKARASRVAASDSPRPNITAHGFPTAHEIDGREGLRRSHR
jgi:hypothetical protein